MSEDLSKFKKKRTAVRSSLTKLINKIEGKINNENEPVDQFEAFIEQLNDKESNLSLLNTLIEDRLSVDTITEDMEASEEIKEKIIFWKTKLSSKIRRINSDSIQVDTVSQNIQVIDSNSFECMNINLPKIPSELVLEFNRSQKDEGFDLSALLQFLHLEIRSRERASQINSHKLCHYSPPPQDRTKNKGSYFPGQRMKPPPNRVHLRPHSFPTPWKKVEPRSRKCLYCHKGHELDACRSFSANEKREILRKKGCCYLCLSPGHREMECVKRESCPICNGSHHFSICFRNRHNDDLSPKRDTDNTVSAVIKTDSEDILTMSVIVNESNISKQLSEFWDLENLGIEAEVSDEENIDNDIISEFEAGISYQNKRYKVKFPWKPNMKTLLENNEEIARKRFLKLRSRFKNNSSLFEDYKLVVNNYLSEKIIERVPFEEENLKHNIFYLPHRAVIRTDKTTRKLRIVFDASSHAKAQLSLNDCLHTELNFIPNLFFLLIKFRVNPIAFVAHIKMAFLIIEIDESERDFTRFFWDENPGIDLENKRLDIFRMTRVLFGVKSSPFLLAATMKHHLKKYVDIFPDTFNHLNQSLYVDDFLCGNVNVQAALTTCIESKQILEDASMDLRKWRTNSSELNQRLKNLNFEVDEHKESLNTLIASKVLGVGWNEKSDTFYFDSTDLETFLSKRINTKRYLLQVAGRLFDPVGFIGPYTIRIKCLIQEIWCLGLDWDDKLPKQIEVSWNKWCNEIHYLSEIKIPRYYFQNFLPSNATTIQLHCFSDASKKAYGTVTYLRIELNDGNIISSFVASKGRVAPLKTLSIPRLELMGALLSARLSDKIATALILPVNRFYWTD
ncbi:uncharacterized protein TNCV_2436861 [Trichonephila clavipes]|nr:uncharacterized protein TNCV_2436861 [Trichonephila clavipes]